MLGRVGDERDIWIPNVGSVVGHRARRSPRHVQSVYHNNPSPCSVNALVVSTTLYDLSREYVRKRGHDAGRAASDEVADDDLTHLVVERNYWTSGLVSS